MSRPRLVPDGAVCLIMTRWKQDDLAGWLLDQEAGWINRLFRGEKSTVLSMPAITEEDDGWRNAGEALWPERYSLPALELIRREVGSRAWASEYQQRPSAAEAAVLKRSWSSPTVTVLQDSSV